MTDTVADRLANLIPAAVASLQQSPDPVRAASRGALSCLETAAGRWAVRLDRQAQEASERVRTLEERRLEILRRGHGSHPRREDSPARGFFFYDSSRGRFDLSDRKSSTVNGDLLSVLAERFPDCPGAPWNTIPLGIGAEGPVVWDVHEAAHLLATGIAGAGKTNLQSVIIEHCLEHPDRWSVSTVDLHGFNFHAYGESIERATGIDSALRMFRNMEDLMSRRYQQMASQGVACFEDLPDEPPAVMIVVDELYGLMATSGIRTDEMARMDADKEEIATIVREIAARGRAAGIHLALSTQRLDAAVIDARLRSDIGARVAIAGLDAATSQLLLSSDRATGLTRSPGRGYFQVNGEGEPFQAYLAHEQRMPRS